MKQAFFIAPLLVTALALPLHANSFEPDIPLLTTPSSDKLTGTLQLGWDSRYYTEGRDELDGDSLLTTSAEVSFENFAIGFWYGISPEQNYDEFQVIATYFNHIGGFDYYLSFAHLEFFNFFPTREFDNEIGFGISYGDLPYDFSLALDASYSFEATGYYAELSLERSQEITDNLSFTATGILGINQGFVSDGHDGLNHFGLRAGLDYALTGNLSLSGHVTYTAPIDHSANAPGDESLTNFSHTGVSLQWEF